MQELSTVVLVLELVLVLDDCEVFDGLISENEDENEDEIEKEKEERETLERFCGGMAAG